MTKVPVLSWEELVKLELTEREDIVDGLIPRGSFSLLSGREKAGKSLLANDLGLCVALDEPFIDRSVISGPVVFVSAEEHIREVRSRMAERIGTRTDVEAFVLQADGTHDGYVLRIDTEQGIVDIMEVIKQYEPALMIFDVLREFHSGLEDKSDEMAPVMRPIREIAHTTDTAIVIIHHASRGGDARGSTAIGGSVDQKIGFERIGDADSEVLRVRIRIEGRFGPRTIIHAKLGAQMRWETDSTITFPQDNRARTRILMVLDDQNGPLTAQELTGRIEDHSLKTIQNTISEMMRSEQSPLLASGTGKKHDPKRYELADTTDIRDLVYVAHEKSQMKENETDDVISFIPEGQRVYRGESAGNKQNPSNDAENGSQMVPIGPNGSRPSREESYVAQKSGGNKREQTGTTDQGLGAFPEE